jgi:anion-transporting  ArsA/GET3 family ATPase
MVINGFLYSKTIHSSDCLSTYSIERKSFEEKKKTVANLVMVPAAWSLKLESKSHSTHTHTQIRQNKIFVLKRMWRHKIVVNKTFSSYLLAREMCEKKKQQTTHTRPKSTTIMDNCQQIKRKWRGSALPWASIRRELIKRLGNPSAITIAVQTRSIFDNKQDNKNS